MAALKFSLIPMIAIMFAAILAGWRTPGEKLVAAMQHLAAGVVFAAAATEILPLVKHGGSPSATLIGGALGVAVMLSLKAAENRFKGPVALLAAIGLDLAIDGLVLGLAFIAGEKAGPLLAVALTLEVLFLALTLTNELAGNYRKAKAIGLTCALTLLLPIGALVAQPVALLTPVWITGFLSFGLMALLYLVTEELLVEAHGKPDSPLISAANLNHPEIRLISGNEATRLPPELQPALTPPREFFGLVRPRDQNPLLSKASIYCWRCHWQEAAANLAPTHERVTLRGIFIRPVGHSRG